MIYACKEADEYEKKLKRSAKKVNKSKKKENQPWQYKKILVKTP